MGKLKDKLVGETKTGSRRDRRGQQIGRRKQGQVKNRESEPKPLTGGGLTTRKAMPPVDRSWGVDQGSASKDQNMHMKVMTEQFVLDGDKLTHAPTGATFWLGDKDVVACEFGRLKVGTEDDYSLDELKEAAWRIMTIERSSRSQVTPFTS